MSRLPSPVLMYASAYAGLAFGVCEWGNGLPFEVKYIWKNTNLPRHLRWIYLTSRYSGLLGLVVYPAAMHYVSRSFTSRWPCNVFWLVQQCLSFSNLAMFLAVFAKRVHALWAYDTGMGIFLFILVASDFATNVIVSVIGLSKSEYGERNCLLVGYFPKEVLYLCGKDILIQLCLWSLAFSRCASLSETLVATLLYCVVPCFIIVDGIWNELAIQMTQLTYLSFPAFLSMTSGVTCRMVQNMHMMYEKALEDRMAVREEGFVLTSTLGTFLGSQ